MALTTESMIFAVAVFAFAASVQTATGFGFGMISVPLLLGTGLDMTTVIPMVVGASLGQLLTGVHRLRREIDWRRSFRIAVWQVVGMVPGVWAMAHWLAGSQAVARQVTGIALLLLVVVLTRFRPVRAVAGGERDRGSLAGGASGFLGGVVAMGGPPLVLYALAQDWSKNRVRGFLWAQFLLANPVLLAVLAWRFGTQALVDAAMGLATTPAIWIGMWAGFAVTRRWQRRELDRAAFALLVIIGVSSVLGPWLSGG